ncbi:uncharacterized protein LOC112094468 [Morus notabilis]|uniref:uncharacterized protein LOC112094468 n=1 Tax=Morus notabilis TaxID=981085 RepID=UPI000CED3EEB|nr:uncharacterized protein LOC112094468 [Morus notabilis]
MNMPPRRTCSMMANQKSQEGQNPTIEGRNLTKPPIGNQELVGVRPNRKAKFDVVAEDAPMNPVNTVVGNQVIGDQCGDAKGVGDSEANNNPRLAKSNRSENENRRNAVLVESSSVCGGDLREQLNARRDRETQQTKEEELAAENKVLPEKMARPEKQIGTRLNNFEQVVRKVAKAVNVDVKIYTSHDHPFTENIIQVLLPDKYKPPLIPLYDGMSDPDDHLEVYMGHMVLHGYPEDIMCQAFRNHLCDSARRYFRSLKPNSITNWDDLKNDFLTQFIGVKKYITLKQNLSRVYQGPNESLKDWIARFRKQVVATEGITDEVALMGALLSMKKDIPYSTDLDQRPQ